MALRQWYPPIEVNESGFLAVDKTHQLYYEVSGNPNGKPIVFLHGGPGAGTKPLHRQLFDPKKYRIVIFDQRGAGQSTPHANLENNSTWDLVADIEKLRTHLNVDKWVVFGGSWGSTLSMAYAITHPDRVKGLILRGIFLCRKQDIDWFYEGKGAQGIFPDEWERFVKVIPPDERGDMVKAYYKRLVSPDMKVQIEAAKAWSRWEGATLHLIPEQEEIDSFSGDMMAQALARIECHYFINNAFFKTGNWLIENVEKIRKIPAVIVHGRYDVVCPFDNAWDLHKAWPEAKLEIIKDAGHGVSEPGITDALIRATDEFAKY